MAPRRKSKIKPKAKVAIKPRLAAVFDAGIWQGEGADWLIVNTKLKVAMLFGVSLPTVNDWTSQGMPGEIIQNEFVFTRLRRNQAEAGKRHFEIGIHPLRLDR